MLLGYLLTFSHLHKGSILELENCQAELQLDFEGHLTGGKRCHGLNIDITLWKCLRLTTVDWRWIYIMSVLRGGDWSSGRLKGLSSSIQQTFTGAWDSPSTACNPAGEIGVFRPSLSLNAYEWTNVPLRAPKDGYGEQQSYKFQPACSELGEDGKQREKAKGLLVRWSRNFLFPHFKQ